MLVIKLSGAAVFAAAALVGVGVLTTRTLFYYLAIGLYTGRSFAGLAVIPGVDPLPGVGVRRNTRSLVLNVL